MTKRVVFEESGHYYTRIGATATEVSPGGSATDPNAIHKSTPGEIAALTLKETPGSSDVVMIEDASASNAKRRVTVSSLSGSGGVPEAPNDGKPYLRNSTAWAEATPSEIGADASGAATTAVSTHLSSAAHITHAQIMSRVLLGG